MPLVPCPDCFRRKSTFDDRGNGECKPCRGTGVNLDPISGLFTAPISTAAGIADKCWCCGGDGQCKTCGGQGEIREARSGEETGSQRSETGATERTSHSGSREAATKVRDDESPGAHSLAGLGSPIGGLAGGGGGGGCGCALIILFIIIGIPAGWFIQRQKKRAYIAELGTVRMNVSVGGQDADGRGAIRYAHGRSQTLQVFINWDNQAVFWSERPIQTTLSRNGRVHYSHLFQHEELPQFNALVFDITDKFPIGRYIVRASVEGAPPAEYAFIVQPRPPGDIFVSDNLFNGWPQNRLTILVHRPGENQKIYIGASLRGTLLGEGRVVYVALLHEGVPMFNSSYQVKEQNRNFYLPYEYDFAPGSYTARLSAEGEPPCRVFFRRSGPSPRNSGGKATTDYCVYGQHSASDKSSRPSGGAAFIRAAGGRFASVR